MATRLADVAINRLFDALWYCATYPDVAAAGENPLRHYLTFGGREGRDPNPLFDSAWYTQQHPDFELTPLEDYLERGLARGWAPNPFFDPQWYLTAYPDVAAAGLEPLFHYLSAGAEQGRDPHPLFSSSWYQHQHPAAAGVTPLEHFLRWGAARGVRPHPLFDPVWYCEQTPRLDGSELPPLRHYLQHGAQEPRDPHPLFANAWYLASNPDVAAAGVNPLEHYLRHGAREMRDPHPLFASRWYVERNADVRESGCNPLVQYVTAGAREGRAPHPLFDAEFYLRQQRDPEPAALAPLQHYLMVGWRRGLKPHPDFDPTSYLRDNPAVRDVGVEPLTDFVTRQRVHERVTLPVANEPSMSGEPAGQDEEVFHPPPPTIERIELPPLPETVKLTISVLLYHREDLAPAFLRTLLPQIRAAGEHPSLVPTLYLSFNYQPSTDIRAEIDQLVGELLGGSADSVHIVDRGWNAGFGSGHNAVFQRADCDLFVTLNSDLLVESEDWLRGITQPFRATNVAIVGLQANASRLRADGCGIPVREGEDFDFVDGSLLAIRADAAWRFGLFSPTFDYFYFEDVDLCLRYRQIGFEIARIDLPHQHNRSASSRLLPEYAIGNVLNRNRERFSGRWGEYLQTRQLPNRLAVGFMEADRQLQCASLPALFALLGDHPTAVLDLAGVHEQLVPLFQHPRIRLIPAWQTMNAADYLRFSELKQTTSSEVSRPFEVAEALGCTPDFDAARNHLHSLVADSTSRGGQTARGALVYIPRIAPLFAGRVPAPEGWLALEPCLSTHGYKSQFQTELGTFELQENDPLGRAEIESVGLASGADILQAIMRADLVISSDHWITELSQVAGVKTFLWLGAISPVRSVWNFATTGFFSDGALPCLGCFHRYGQQQRNTCLRGDIACMRPSLLHEVAEALDQFLRGAPIAAAEISVPHLRESALRPAASPELPLEILPRSEATSVLVLIPTNPLLGQAALDRARQLAERAVERIPRSRVVLDSSGKAPLRGQPHPHRQEAMAALRQQMIDRHLRDERWVFWVDADIVDYPANLIDELISRAEGGIAAPLVLMEGQRNEPISNQFGFGPGRFYDVAGFVERGHWARFAPPYFDQLGPVYQLDSVGSCYLVNAELYRHGAKHSLDRASRAFIEADAPWTDDAISRNQAGPANCFTEHYSVCDFARASALPVQAFADLIAYHERAPAR